MQITIAAPSSVWSDDVNLYWPFTNFRGPRRRPRAVNIHTLEKFVTLADAPTEKIVDFASRWGVLGMCRAHDLPHSEAPGCFRRLFGIAEDRRLVEIHENDPYDYLYIYESEPISAWRYYAQQFRSLLRLAGELNAGGVGDMSDWEVVIGDRTSPDDLDPDPLLHLADASYARFIVCQKIDDYMEIGNFRFTLEANDEGFYIRYGSACHYRLFGALANLLMVAAARPDTLVTCSICGKPYRTSRAPDPGRHSYCSKKCRKLGNAMAARKYRKRRRQPHQ